MTIDSFIVLDEDDAEPTTVTCENGCPDGGLGQHKFSCHWAGGTWYLNNVEVLVTGEGSSQVCLTAVAGGEHRHVSRDYPGLARR